MAWEEVIFGALGGAVTSLFAAAAIGERAERGRVRAQASHNTRGIIDRYAAELRIAAQRKGAGPASELDATKSDHQVAFARSVLAESVDLGLIRRRQILRALRALVGPFHLRMADEAPHNPNDPAGEGMRISLWMASLPPAVMKEVNEDGFIDKADKQPTDVQVWETIDSAMRRLRKVV